VELVERGRHLLAQRLDEHGRVQRFAELLVVLGPAGLEVGREVLVGVAPRIGADHPDLLAPQLLAQRLERDDFVHYAGDPGPALGVVFEDQLRPVARRAPMRRDSLIERVVGQVPRLGVAADERQRVDHRSMRGVVAAELEDLQQGDQAAAVVTGVGGPQRGLHRAPVQRPLRLVLVHQLAQRLLAAGHRREDHLADRVVGLRESGFGDREQNVLLARHPPERVDQLVVHPALGPSPDAMDGRDQQIDQRVGDLPLPLMHQRGEQRDRQRFGVTP